MDTYRYSLDGHMPIFKVHGPQSGFGHYNFDVPWDSRVNEALAGKLLGMSRQAARRRLHHPVHGEDAEW